MAEIAIAASFALLLTLMLAFRFSVAEQPKRLVFYFGMIFSVQYGGEYFFLPPGTLPVEIAYVCFALCIPFGLMNYLSHRFPDAGHPRR